MNENEFDFGAEYAAFGDDLKDTAYEGEYDMVVKKAKPGTSSKGKAMFTVTLAFLGGPLGAKGKEIIDRLYWSPESETAAKIFAANLKVMGAPQDWVRETRPKASQIAEQITGSKIKVRLKAEEFGGRPQTRVSYLSTLSARPVTGTAPISTAQAQAVSLDDDDEPAKPATKTTAADPAAQAAELPEHTTQEPVTAGVSAGGSDNPWE